MFGLFRKKPAPEGPVAFEFEEEIAVPAQELFRIVDFADEKCWKRDVGTVDKVGENKFVMRLDMLPDVDFAIGVLDVEQDTLYSYDCVSDPLMGNLERSIEGYQIDPTGEDSCHVTLVVMAEFREGLSKKEWDGEVQMMAMAVMNSLAKLKLHAEQGVEAIREVEKMQMVDDRNAA